MCRIRVEIQYKLCAHFNCWGIPSPDPNCNGILHRFEEEHYKPCIKCWVLQGNRKKQWKCEERLRKLDPVHRKRNIHANRIRVLYPMQELGLTRTSPCKTWRQRMPWHTRIWAQRQLRNARVSRVREAELWRTVGHMLDVYTIDEEAKESELLEIVPIDEIKEMERLKSDPNYRISSNCTENIMRERLENICAICHSPFYGEDELENNCSGGGEVARRLPCPGHHVVGLECIIEAWKFALNNPEVDPEERKGECPLCRTDFNLVIEPTRTINKRIGEEMEDWFLKYQDSQRVNGPRDKDPINFKTYAGISAAFIAALPMFHTVNHCMNIHNAKHGGRIPYGQMAAVFLTGTILQTLWLIGMLSLPVSLPIYALCKHRKKVRASVKAAFVNALKVIWGDYNRQVELCDQFETMLLDNLQHLRSENLVDKVECEESQLFEERIVY